MTRKKVAVILAFVTSIAAVDVSQAAPVVTNTDAIKAAASESVTKAQWQWFLGGAAAGVLANHYYHKYYGCGGYGCGGYGPRYGYYGPPRYSYYYGPPRYYYGGW